jgi:hypothetical protein
VNQTRLLGRAGPALAAALALLLSGIAPPALAEPAAAPVAEVSPPTEEPWRVHDAVGAPAWLRFGLEHRSRVEQLEHDFRANATGTSRALSLRTLLSAELALSALVVGAELQDSRAYATQETPLSTALVNPLEPLQAYVGLRLKSLITEGDQASMTLGRMTLDLGSRRLVSRTEFRNTIYSFTGIDLQWSSAEHHLLRAFAVVPVVMLPTAPADLSRNRIQLDQENFNVAFWGVFFGAPEIAPGLQLETYVFGLHERDSTLEATPDRRLVTPGLRLLRAPAAGQPDFQVELMGQLGRSRATRASTDTTDLAHRAGSLHATVGYSFDAPWAPRLALQGDYASGDKRPDDKLNGRFDPLFGDRRFELGPTGIYGAFARSNLRSLGARLELSPTRHFDAFAGYRLLWLAASRDAWTTAGVSDPSGKSGRFLGQQLEARLRWQILPRNLALELGAALLLRGYFARNAPGGRDDTPLYGYTQITATL